MATSEKLLYTCRNAMPFRPRVCYGVTLAGGAAVTVRAWRSSGGTVRQAILTPGDAAARRQGLAESALTRIFHAWRKISALRASTPALRACAQDYARVSLEQGAKHRVETCQSANRALTGAYEQERRSCEIGGLSGGVTVGCLAVQESLTLWLNSPLASRAKAEKVLPSLLDIQLPFPLEDCLYQFVEFRRTPEGTVSALVCAARREAIQACLGRYQAQGADPMLLDHEGLALWTQSLAEWPARNATHPPATLAPYRVLVYLANDHTTLVIGCGERYGNAYSLQMPACHEQAGPESTEGRSASNDGLVNRLQLLLHAGLPAGTGVQWLFCGARAGETAVVETLHQSLTLVWPGSLTRHKEPASFLARALCERALKRGPLRCNLRQQTFTHPAVRRAVDRRARAAAVGILVAGLLLAGFSLTSRLLGERRFNLIKAEIAAVAGELAPGMTIPYGREIPEVQKAWEKQALLTAPFLDAFAPSLAPRLAEVVKAGQASAVRFETLSLRRNSLALTGVAEDWDQCGQLEQRLKALGYAVKLQRQEAIAENEVRFTVNAEGGGP